MRCKSCDAALEPSEIIWRESDKQHEELCRVCRDKLDEDLELSIHYEQDFDLFDTED